jgi:multisubunit Na+/H+ antiporter MnhG subunit
LLPETTLKVIALALFMVITSPVGAHAIASAAQRSGVPMIDAQRDDLAAKAQATDEKR